MAIGSVLIQPERVRRATSADPGMALIGDLLALGTRLATDAQDGGRIAELARDAADRALRNLLESRRTAFQNAAPRLRDWALRALRASTGIGPELRVGSPAEALGLSRTVLQAFSNAAAGATAARIRPYVAELLQIVETELGLGLPALEALLWQIVEDVVDALEAEPPEASHTARENRLDTIRMLRRVRKLVRGRFLLPSLNADRIADAIAAYLRRADAGSLAARIACINTGLGAIADAAGSIDTLIPLGSFSEFRSLGAAAAAADSDETYCWYASWLLEDDVVINAARTQIRRGDQVIATGERLTIADIPVFRSTSSERYTFGVVDLEAMETMAYVMFVSGDALAMLLHLISLEEGDYASNTFNAAINAFMGVGKLIAKRPLMSGAVDDYAWPLIWAFIGSFEGIHRNASTQNFFTMWSVLLGTDVVEALLLRQISGAARDGVLSFFTLINYQGDFYSAASPDPRPLNRKHLDGVANPIASLIFNKVFLGAIYPRDEYGHPFSSTDHGVKVFLFWDLFIGTLFTALGRLVGCLVAMGLSRTFDPVAWSFSLLWKIPINWVLFFISLNMEKEGDTDGGRYNATRARFDGYPPHDSSPYSLPYPKDVSCYLDQANLGYFSHHELTLSQTYSYDFALDQDQVILAARPGTVVSFHDTTDDDTTGAWNYILIRHDCDDSGNPTPPDPVHDKGAGGTVGETYCVYGHGRKNSVTDLFAARGIAQANIVGSKVKRGHAIMRSGDTGVSYHNHLHMAVTLGNPDVAPRKETIPFVFKDVTNLIGPDGVCKAMNSYTATTERVF